MATKMEVKVEAGQLHWNIQTEDGHELHWAMSADEARGMWFAVGTQIAKLQREEPENPASLFEQATMLDVLSPTFQVGSDEEGRPVLALKVDPLPVFKYRFEDKQAATIARTFTEIVNSPRDVRLARKQ